VLRSGNEWQLQLLGARSHLSAGAVSVVSVDQFMVHAGRKRTEARVVARCVCGNVKCGVIQRRRRSPAYAGYAAVTRQSDASTRRHPRKWAIAIGGRNVDRARVVTGT